jgi:hypothetical protein
VTSLLQHDLVWLGIVEPGHGADQHHPAVRVTPVGAWLLGSGAQPPAPPASLLAEPSMRLLVYEVDSSLLWSLLAFADPEQLDRVSLFRLSRASVVAGLAATLTDTAMIAALERTARFDLPQNVVYTVRDWARGARHARLRRALILTFDSDRARDDALALPRLRDLAPEPLPAAQLLVPIGDEAAEQRARAVLRELGFGIDELPGHARRAPAAQHPS